MEAPHCICSWVTAKDVICRIRELGSSELHWEGKEKHILCIGSELQYRLNTTLETVNIRTTKTRELHCIGDVPTRLVVDIKTTKNIRSCHAHDRKGRQAGESGARADGAVGEHMEAQGLHAVPQAPGLFSIVFFAWSAGPGVYR